MPSPDLRRTEYVTALVSLGAGQSVLPTLQAAGVANGASDGVPGDVPYTGSQADVDAIANAHCAIWAAAAQGTDEGADWQRFRSGDYGSFTAQGLCGAGCPAECGCKATSEIDLSDVLGPPTDYVCKALPPSCVPDAGVARECACFPQGTRCLSFCGHVDGPGLQGFHLTCRR